MSNAIWMITYQLLREREAPYLKWFHEVHVPEKLARPGYSWVSHYRSTTESTDDGTPLYLAMFGGYTSYYEAEVAKRESTLFALQAAYDDGTARAMNRIAKAREEEGKKKPVVIDINLIGKTARRQANNRLGYYMKQGYVINHL